MSSYINSDWMCFSRCNLNDALKRRNKLRLSNCLQASVFLSKTKHPILVASHRVDVTILWEEVGMCLTTSNLFDEDVITAHFRQFYHWWIWLFIEVCCFICACICCFKAKLTKFGVSHHVNFGVGRYEDWLWLRYRSCSGLIWKWPFLRRLIINLNFVLTHQTIWTSLSWVHSIRIKVLILTAEHRCRETLHAFLSLSFV